MDKKLLSMDKCGQIWTIKMLYQFCKNSHLVVPTSQTCGDSMVMGHQFI